MKGIVTEDTFSWKVGAYSPGGLFYAHYDVIGLVRTYVI